MKVFIYFSIIVSLAVFVKYYDKVDIATVPLVFFAFLLSLLGIPMFVGYFTPKLNELVGINPAFGNNQIQAIIGFAAIVFGLRCFFDCLKTQESR